MNIDVYEETPDDSFSNEVFEKLHPNFPYKFKDLIKLPPEQIEMKVQIYKNLMNMKNSADDDYEK